MDATWYEIEPGLWCASGQGWTTFRAGRPTLYAVSFPLVSAGDKSALVQLGDERRLQYTVSERKEE